MTIRFKARIASGLVVGALLTAVSRSKAQDRNAEISVPADRISQPITGLLITKKVFGPPGYGENPKTDVKRNIYVLETGLRIRLSGDASSPTTRGLQLFFGEDNGPNSWAAAERQKGKCVAVSGSVSEAQVGPEHTPLVLQVATIQAAPRAACRGINPPWEPVTYPVPEAHRPTWPR